MARDIKENDNTAFVVYVPPSSTDKTVESCLRLGTGPAGSNLATLEENQTYNDAVGTAQALSGLSLPTYSPANGIALLTPGTINMVGAGGVNITCDNYTHSNIGLSYVVTQATDPTGHPTDIVSASFTGQNKVGGAWATVSFNKAVNVAVNVVPLQASILLGPSYSISGPLNLSNAWGAIWNSTAGWAVSAQFGRSVAIGVCSAVVTDFNGSTNAYYTKAQGSNTGQQFNWSVPLAAGYAGFDKMQGIYCKIVNGVSIAVGLVAEVYAIVGAAMANKSSTTPGDMQAWLKQGETIAVVCTAADGVLWAAGCVLGFLVDNKLRPSKQENWAATAVTIQDRSIELTTKSDMHETDDDDDPGTPYLDATRLKLERKTDGAGDDSGTITLTTGEKGATITLDGSTITIQATTINLKGKVNMDPSTPAPPTPSPERTVALGQAGLDGAQVGNMIGQNPSPSTMTPASSLPPPQGQGLPTPQDIGLSGDGSQQIGKPVDQSVFPSSWKPK